MPSKPMKPCNKIGCPNLTTERYCEQHKQEERRYDRGRGSASQRGYDAKWRKARLRFLRQNPLCVHCLDEDEITPATVVDHIQAHKGDRELFWDEDNWQALCKMHHDIKTAKEDGGFGNAIT